jgi:glutaredoxin
VVTIWFWGALAIGLAAYLERRKIPFTEIDVSADARAAAEMIELSGQNGVPVTVESGKTNEVVLGGRVEASRAACK